MKHRDIEIDIAASVARVDTHQPGLIDGYRDAEPALRYSGRAPRSGRAGGPA